MFRIKNMSVEDLAFAIQLTDTMNWNLTEMDFQFMMKLEPNGCFIVLENSQKIGLATTINFGSIGWLGNVIVSEPLRGRGAGSQLIKYCIRYLSAIHVKTIGLYSYLQRVPFYQRHGFEYDSDFTVLQGKGFSTSNPCLNEARKDDFLEIVHLDSCCFGGSRKRLLESLILNSDNRCYIYSENQQMMGFVVVKVYNGMAEVGPLICQPGRRDVATSLLLTALSKLIDVKITMVISEKEYEILGLLLESGFIQMFKVARMYRGQPFPKGWICIAESLERG